MKRVILSSLLLLATSVAWTDDNPMQTPGSQAEIPPQIEAGESLEPDVTIIESDKETIHQYSINGQVYMVKVIPRNGPPYYLLDTDGDGVMDVQPDGPRDVAVPQWVLFSW